LNKLLWWLQDPGALHISPSCAALQFPELGLKLVAWGERSCAWYRLSQLHRLGRKLRFQASEGCPWL